MSSSGELVAQETAVLMVGLPGRFASAVARAIRAHSQLSLAPYAFVSPSFEGEEVEIEGQVLTALRPEKRGELLEWRTRSASRLVAFDATTPHVVLENVRWYLQHGVPAVVATSGVTRADLERELPNGDAPLLFAPNTAREIVALLAMFEFAAQEFPGLFAGYQCAVRESHQSTKLDKSGTAREVLRSLRALGVDADDEIIEAIRDPDAQRALGVPEDALAGHGWHYYSLTAPHRQLAIEVSHRINGRAPYLDGATAALLFLAQQDRHQKKLYTMLDVLRAG